MPEVRLYPELMVSDQDSKTIKQVKSIPLDILKHNLKRKYDLTHSGCSILYYKQNQYNLVNKSNAKNLTTTK